MISPRDLPREVTSLGFELPSGYFRVFELGLTNLEPWRFLAVEEFAVRYSGMASRYPNRLAIPFAQRQDNDDVACIVVDSNDHVRNHVLIVHDFASRGWEVNVDLESFWDWFIFAIKEMVSGI
jgi:hypothetical protein